MIPQRRDGAPDALTVPRLPQRRREQETHRSNERILSDLGPACAAGTAGPEILEEDRFRAEQSGRQGEVHFPRFALSSLVVVVSQADIFTTETQRHEDT